MANDHASRLAKIEGEGDDAVVARAAIAVVPVGRDYFGDPQSTMGPGAFGSAVDTQYEGLAYVQQA